MGLCLNDAQNGNPWETHILGKLMIFAFSPSQIKAIPGEIFDIEEDNMQKYCSRKDNGKEKKIPSLFERDLSGLRRKSEKSFCKGHHSSIHSAIRPLVNTQRTF
jgi:hypothetical protein